MDKNVKYPTIDRSGFIPERHRDISYGEGNLRNGRPFRVECWFEQSITYLSFLMPTLGIEDADNTMLKALLISEGLVEFYDEKFIASGFSGDNVDAHKENDSSGNRIWVITIIVGDEDGTYIGDHFPLKRKFKFLYQEDSKPKEYFIALCQEDLLYYPYFINNSNENIELMIEDGESEYRDIQARSFVGLSTGYYDWEFDWEISINIYIKTVSKEFYLCYNIRLRKGETCKNIPIINKSGLIFR